MLLAVHINWPLYSWTVWKLPFFSNVKATLITSQHHATSRELVLCHLTLIFVIVVSYHLSHIERLGGKSGGNQLGKSSVNHGLFMDMKLSTWLSRTSSFGNKGFSPPLKLTAKVPENSCLESLLSFWSFGLFSGAFAVTFRKGTVITFGREFRSRQPQRSTPPGLLYWSTRRRHSVADDFQHVGRGAKSAATVLLPVPEFGPVACVFDNGDTWAERLAFL